MKQEESAESLVMANRAGGVQIILPVYTKAEASLCVRIAWFEAQCG